MDFFSIVLFLISYYVRPQEWSPAFAGFPLVAIIVVLALVSTLFRPQGISWRDFFQTPHDWLMLAYLAWIVFTNEDSWETFKQSYNLFFFYWIVVQAITNRQRLEKYLGWWTALVFWVAVMALLGEYGFDPVGSYDLTHGFFRDRLIFNTSIFNNPNALGHGVVIAIPLIYFLLFWKRPVPIKFVALALMLVPLWCVYLTQSKGSFVAGFVALVASLMFGRARYIQALILVAAVTVGWAALKQLPRMQEMDRSRQSEAIMGRLRAFEFGLQAMNNNPHGVGYRNFFVKYYEQDPENARYSHCAYNEVGAELGYGGLLLFVSLMYSCLRTLMTARTANTEAERCRRMLFVLIVSYIISAWMIDFAYRASFFITVAVIAAFHRLMRKEQADQMADETQSTPATLPQLVPVGIGAMPFPVPAMQTSMPMPAEGLASLTSSASAFPLSENKPAPASEPAPAASPGIKWRRIGIVDLVLIWLLTEGVIRMWRYIIDNF